MSRMGHHEQKHAKQKYSPGSCRERGVRMGFWTNQGARALTAPLVRCPQYGIHASVRVHAPYQRSE